MGIGEEQSLIHGMWVKSFPLVKDTNKVQTWALINEYSMSY